nr:hypothetical protein [Candidatus Freyarchaeota archaeon]MDO8083161.1 hypothetical protein [Candidatus Freyarchaeota archaeon]
LPHSSSISWSCAFSSTALRTSLFRLASSRLLDRGIRLKSPVTCIWLFRDIIGLHLLVCFLITYNIGGTQLIPKS